MIAGVVRVIAAEIRHQGRVVLLLKRLGLAGFGFQVIAGREVLDGMAVLRNVTGSVK